MKKLIVTGLFAVSFMLIATSSMANGTPVPEAVAEGVEISGAVDVVAGWQHDDQDAGATGGSIGGLADYDGNLVGGVAGNTANADHFRFVVNQVEIDLGKSFGENIRLRADIDVGDFANTGQLGADLVDLEQAYVTANLAAGNGIEFLIGKFNAPVGVESVDTRDNWFISYAPPHRYLIPTNVTGAKLYYAFSDLIDLHFAIVNDFNANGFGDSMIPSSFFRLGFNWGDEGNESTVGISGGIGPEKDNAIGLALVGLTLSPRGNWSNNKHLDFFGDLDVLIALSDTVNLAVEGVYRQSDSSIGGANQKAIAGFAAVNYEASDVWDVNFRAGYLWEINPPVANSSGASTTSITWTGAASDGYLISGALGAGYMIADGAKLKLEYRFDWYHTAVVGINNNDAQSLVGQFAYTF